MSDCPVQPRNLKFAWSEVPAATPPKRNAALRIADFLEIYGPYDEQTAREQAARCVQCPEPQCVEGCPLGNRIPEWLALTADGNFLEAASLLHSTGSLPELCARVCPADRLCEGHCILDGRAEPVSIWAIEQFLNEYAFAHGVASAGVPPSNGRRVAILGAGPGGLACADELSRLGYVVEAFDSRSLPGGQLIHGVPEFRVEKSLVQRRIDLLEKRGVKFHLSVDMTEGCFWEELKPQFEAIYLAFPARQPRPLMVPGAQFNGVFQGSVYLLQQSAGGAVGQPLITVEGRRVIVLGAGDLAMDCVRSVLRLGAATALCAYRRGELDMTCSRHEFENARDEGATFEFHATPLAVYGDLTGCVRGVRFARTAGAGGVATLNETEFAAEGDLVLVALGFDLMPAASVSRYLGATTDARGRLLVDGRQMTNLPGVFAGGDLVHGPCSVLQAVRDARSGAKGIVHYLQVNAAKI